MRDFTVFFHKNGHRYETWVKAQDSFEAGDLVEQQNRPDLITYVREESPILQLSK